MPHEGRAEFVPDEVAVTLACTKAAAAHRYGLALAVSEHPAVLTAWRRGAIDARKVHVICDGLTDVSSPAVEALAEEAAGYAASRTAPEVRRWLSRRVISADPGMAEVRRARANADPEGHRELRCPTASPSSTRCSRACKPGRSYDSVNTLAHCVRCRRRPHDGPEARRRIDGPHLRAGRPSTGERAGRGAGRHPARGVRRTRPRRSASDPSRPPKRSSWSVSATSVAADCDDLSPGPHDVVFRRLLTDPDTGYLRRRRRASVPALRRSSTAPSAAVTASAAFPAATAPPRPRAPAPTLTTRSRGRAARRRPATSPSSAGTTTA